MPDAPNQIVTNFIDNTNADLGSKFVTKNYLAKIYPYLNVPGGLKYSTLWSVRQGEIPYSAGSYNVWGNEYKFVANSSGLYGFINNNNNLLMSGFNSSGQIGDGTTVDRTVSPIQIGTNSWKSVSCRQYATAAIRNDGTLWTWGYNNSGQLGIISTSGKSSPVQVGTASNWTQVQMGLNACIALKSDGSLWAWGGSVQVGYGDGIDKSSPVQIGTSSWSAISCSYYNVLAIRTDGALFSWGDNYRGQVGNSISPHIINGVSSPVQIGTSSWSSVSSGSRVSYAIRSDNTLWAWGANNRGQLGDGTTNDRSSPVQVGTENMWRQISAGTECVSAIKFDGTMWGLGGSFTLPSNYSISYYSSPVQLGTSSNNWKSVYSGTEILAFRDIGDNF